MFVCAPHACLVFQRLEEGIKSPRTGTQMAVSHHSGAGNQIQVFFCLTSEASLQVLHYVIFIQKHF